MMPPEKSSVMAGSTAWPLVPERTSEPSTPVATVRTVPKYAASVSVKTWTIDGAAGEGDGCRSTPCRG